MQRGSELQPCLCVPSTTELSLSLSPALLPLPPSFLDNITKSLGNARARKYFKKHGWGQVEGSNYKEKYESKAARLYKREMQRKLRDALREDGANRSQGGSSASPAQLLGGTAPVSPKAKGGGAGDASVITSDMSALALASAKGVADGEDSISASSRSSASRSSPATDLSASSKLKVRRSAPGAGKGGLGGSSILGKSKGNGKGKGIVGSGGLKAKGTIGRGLGGKSKLGLKSKIGAGGEFG